MQASRSQRTKRTSTTSARRAAVAQAHGKLQCAVCRTLTQLCGSCFRGQRYCSDSCRLAARRRSLRAAGKRYQRTETGRLKHAARQRAYAARRRAIPSGPASSPAPAPPAEPHSSQGIQLATRPTLPTSAPRPGASHSSATAALWACLRCGRANPDGWLLNCRRMSHRRRQARYRAKARGQRANAPPRHRQQAGP